MRVYRKLFMQRKLLLPFCILGGLSILHTQRESLVLLRLSAWTKEKNGTASPFATVRVLQDEFDVSCCGLSWESFLNERLNTCLKTGNTYTQAENPIVWTVSGGDEYRLFLPMLVQHWQERILQRPMLILALDEATASAACDSGLMALHWDAAPQSYSRVADSKFQVAAAWSSLGFFQFFVELDVFCRANPLPLLQSLNEQTDIVLMGHGDLQQKINIGLYYVRPTVNTTALFTTTSRILAPSLDTTLQYRGNDHQKHDYFDQDIFHNCLGASHGRGAVMYPSDYEADHIDALAPCHAILVKFRIASNLYFSSYRPPVVYDTTLCIHPLDIRPFTSIRTKLATAKYFGFDPAKYDGEKKFLKTASGDLTFSEDWNTGFFADEFTHQQSVRYRCLQRPIALLVALAQASRRTLVLPRNIRDKSGKAFPVFSLVSTASIERMGLEWRFWPRESWHGKSEEGASAFRIVALDDTHGRSVQDVVENVTQSCWNATTCALHGLYQEDLYPLEDETGLLDGIIDQLKWCFTPPDFKEGFPFTHGFGTHEWACP